ncbi:hypothetical protein ATANTOWER_027696 [Ataeniobius toweri]|uniref:Uncharacterized protein n=1 Tax=Ataeniobius toweri TaxID=208326 RepID=A0ABU7C1C1_9TELE|nr:hypothetical protein [Ataeniobius toweri]
MTVGAGLGRTHLNGVQGLFSRLFRVSLCVCGALSGSGCGLLVDIVLPTGLIISVCVCVCVCEHFLVISYWFLSSSQLGREEETSAEVMTKETQRSTTFMEVHRWSLKALQQPGGSDPHA